MLFPTRTSALPLAWLMPRHVQGYELSPDELTDFKGLEDLVLLDEWEKQHPNSKSGQPAVCDGGILPQDAPNDE